MSFVCFKIGSGDILAILNGSVDSFESEDNWGYVEVPYNTILPLLTGEETPKSYVVEYNPLLDSHSLKPRVDFDAEELNINDLIYKIPIVEKYKDEDIKIIQDIKNTCWKVLISEPCESKLRTDFANLKYVLHFAITEPNNPHHLYRMLKINLEQLVKNHSQVLDFMYDYEITDTPLSIYTMKRFDSYCYKRNYE
jgi:hypothetical protein